MSKDLVLTGARSRAAQIRSGIHDYLRTLGVIAEAFRQDDWRTLGYANWEAYVDGEFGAERLRLPVEHRLKAVQELRLAGMSQRAIGSAVGASKDTVRRDLSVGANEPTDDAPPPAVKGTDGKSYASTKPAAEPRPAPQPPREEPAPPVEDEPAHDPAAFKRALDEHVPDPEEPLRRWRDNFLKAVSQGGKPLEFTDEDVAAKADEECLAELRRLVASMQSFVDRVEAKIPKPVRTLRVVS